MDWISYFSCFLVAPGRGGLRKGRSICVIEQEHSSVGETWLQELEEAGHMCLQSEIREREGDRLRERQADRHRETDRHLEKNEGGHT